MKTALKIAAISLVFSLNAPAAYADTYQSELAQLTERFKAADANDDGSVDIADAIPGCCFCPGYGGR